MQMGDAGVLLEYFQRRKGENPSFFYAIQVDEDDQLTNIFWADANSIMDYDYFGDVVCFDTIYKDAECGRPFTQFIGVNHHKQPVLFGSAVLYDETVESFKWLFDTFKVVMGSKQPKTILTGRNSIMSEAISTVLPGTVHRYCVWNIYQSAAKNLTRFFKETETFALDFNQCIFEFFEEEDFVAAWKSLLERYDLEDNEWLAKLFEERKNWALPYVQDIFYADIFNTLLREGVNSVLREYLILEIDFLQFLKKYEEFVKERRYVEQEADYLTSQVTPRASSMRVLWQAANVYTHAAFEMFRMEFELLSNCLVYSCGEVGTVSEYEVAVKDKSKVYFVRYDISDGSALCSCKKFDFVGIPCCHVLRVLDCRNVKELPSQYFLKRWRKDAKSGLIRDDAGFPHQDEQKSSLQKRYRSLCRILYKLAARASENIHAYAFMENQSDQILEQVERILQTKLLEETSMNAASKGQSQSQMPGDGMNNENNGECRRLGGRKKKDATIRRRKQSGTEINKRHKGLNGKSDAVEISMDSNDPPMASNEFPSHARNSSNQFFPSSQSAQGPYIPGHHFGLGSFQGFHGTPQFTQEFSAPVLQQQSYGGEAHLGQAPEIHHALQFVASNSQLEPQGGDQGHYTIPVWDFL
ncbi:Protein FAR1-RELATED SEQUENCE 5 [Platanthera zijinensis]|uniref:Protein FAR1-RELATED SEQUENCE n=1 Tax=Platanthera zijinensis TaxID=2320716 RepID=A0AAP0BL44_9ASPA